MSLLLGVTPVGSPVKRVSNDMFADGEPDIDHVGSVWSAKWSKPDLGSSFRTVASVEGAKTDIDLCDIDAMVGQCISSWHARPSRIPVGVAGIDMLPSEELNAAEKFSQRLRYYPSESAKTLLKDFFRLNPPTVLDPGHTTTSLSTDQMILFARAVSPEVTLAPYGLLEDLLVWSHGISAVGSRGLPGRSVFPSFMGSTRG